MDPNDASQVARIAAQQMGAPEQPQQPPANQEAPPTDQEKAAEAGSPETEGDKTSAEPVLFKVKMGEQERELTEAQIAQTFSRYADLNHKHATNKPILDLAERMIQSTGAQPEQVARFMEAAAKAFTKNATMGQPGPQPQPPQQATPAGNLDEEFRKYEEENAITLPPGYRETMNRMNRMEQALMAQLGLTRQVLERAGMGAQQGQEAAQSAQADRQAAIQQSIATNLDRAQAQYQLADEDANTFMAWAGERGYTLEDFADPGLTQKVVGDFAATKNGPEYERLKQLAQRRSAYLEAGGPGPATGAAPATPQGGDDTLARLAEQAVSRRFA